MVYVLLAACLFPEVGYLGVWRKLTAGLAGISTARPTASGPGQARHRMGAAPLRWLFDLLGGPAAVLGQGDHRPRGSGTARIPAGLSNTRLVRRCAEFDCPATTTTTTAASYTLRPLAHRILALAEEIDSLNTRIAETIAA